MRNRRQHISNRRLYLSLSQALMKQPFKKTWSRKTGEYYEIQRL